MKKKGMMIIPAVLICAVILFLLTNGSKLFCYFNDAVSFRLINESGQDIYSASVSFGREDTMFGGITVENADGTPLADHGEECFELPIEKEDLNDTELTDMIFDFYTGTEEDGDTVFCGRVSLVSSRMHSTYTITLADHDGSIVIESNDAELRILDPKDVQERNTAGVSRISDYGLTLSTRDVTSTGLTLLFTQSGGHPEGDLETGYEYSLEQYKDGSWLPVDTAMPEEQIIWGDVAYVIPADGTLELETDWTVLYGELEEGRYRIRKTIMDFRGSGDYDTADISAEFMIQ